MKSSTLNIMIICFNEKINNFNNNNLKKFKNSDEKLQYIQSLMPKITDINNKCPYCKSKDTLIKYGHYKRNLSIFDGNSIENYIVSVQRVMCKGCGRSHALLPNFIVPYVIMACFSIAQIVSKAIKSSAYKLYNSVGLSFQIIYKYILIVSSFFNDFKILNNTKEYVSVKKFNKTYFLANCNSLSTAPYRFDFFEFHSWSLFMSKFRNNSSPPSEVFVSKKPPT